MIEEEITNIASIFKVELREVMMACVEKIPILILKHF